MLLVAGLSALVWLILFLLPLRKRILIEGIFKEAKNDYDLFRAKEFKCFVFEDFCRSCVESWRKTGNMPFVSTLTPTCYVGIHCYSLDISSIKPRAGDAVKLVAWQTIFGRVRLYYFQKSDFVWTNYCDEQDRQEAKTLGYGGDVERYKKDRKQKWQEECITEAMEKEKLTREEAEILACFGFFQDRDTQAKRLGKSISELDEACKKSLRESNYCTEVDGDCLAKRYLENGSLDSDVRDHLNKCSSCNLSFIVAFRGKTDQDCEKIRVELNLRLPHEIDAEAMGITPEERAKRIGDNLTLRYGHGPGCFTMKERITYAKTGNLSSERLSHAESCIGCKRMILADREDVIQTGKIGGLTCKP